MKISILSPDVSTNCLGRAMILAQVLRRRHEVEIVGPAFGGTVWSPAAHEGLAIRALDVRPSLAGAFELRRLLERIDGDVIYASKPLFASFGIGLIDRGRRQKPLVLDIDDWEMGFVRQALASLGGWGRLRYALSSTARPYLNHAYWNRLVLDRLARRADRITVSNRFLQARYGGELVWHGRDTAAFRPEGRDRAAARARHGIAAASRVVLFFGTPHRYKGVEDLIQAVAGLEDPLALLVLAGIGADGMSREVAALARRTLGPRAQVLGLLPFAEVPELLALADVVVVPQRRNPATAGQMPAKLFDAMALARPIVATAVSDIPEALEGCGWVVPPDSPPALRAAIRDALDDPAEAARRGARARERCVARYSWDVMESTLTRVFEGLA